MKFNTILLIAFSLISIGSPAMAADKIEDSVLNRAYDLMQQGDFSGANKLLKPMVRGQSCNVIARRYFSYVLLKQGRIEEASNQIQAMAKLGAHTSFDYWLYAQNYIGAGQRLTGQLCLTKALESLNSPVMLSFLKKYAQHVDATSPTKPKVKIDAGNDQKQFPLTPFAAKAGA